MLSVRDSIGIPKDSVVLPPKALTQEMRWQLVDSVMRIPTSEEVDGRTGYLAGLPTPLRRNPYDALTDLNMIFSQLDGLGRLDSGQWPLLLVIDNILQYVQGFPDVRNLIIKVKQSLEQAYSRY